MTKVKKRAVEEIGLDEGKKEDVDSHSDSRRGGSRPGRAQARRGRQRHRPGRGCSSTCKIQRRSQRIRIENATHLALEPPPIVNLPSSFVSNGGSAACRATCNARGGKLRAPPGGRGGVPRPRRRGGRLGGGRGVCLRVEARERER
jgi:hypothetical protein